MKGKTMHPAQQKTIAIAEKTQFNYNKLQAVACMASSAAVSIGLVYLALRWLG